MGKYEPLNLFLGKIKEEKIVLTFKEIEKILGDNLPPSAREYTAWWANDTSGVHRNASDGWMAANWKVEKVDMKNETVSFIKNNAPSAPKNPKNQAISVDVSKELTKDSAVLSSDVDGRITSVIEELISDYNKGKYYPILEADIVGYFYHLWLLHNNDPKIIHLDTRICQVLEKPFFFDIVIGELNQGHKKPCIALPQSVIEVKMFPAGFSKSQLNKRYERVLNQDLPKLAALKSLKTNRCLLLFDERFYLKGMDTTSKSSRIRNIEKIRDALDPEIKICYIFKKDTLNWDIL